MKTFLPTIGIVSAMALGMLMLGLWQAKATPTFSQQTGLPCTQCHVNPTGIGDLTDFGEKFKANGDKLPAK
jgi:hypothetical protein